MIDVQSLDRATAVKKAVKKDTFEGFVTDIIATHETRQAGAQAFLVEQAPNWVTPPHFHLEHQFQVVTAGSGAIGRHAAALLTVQYAAPETGYGPITAGPEGISYLTLRAAGDTGAWYLHKPGSRERMQPGRKREQQHGVPATPLAAEALAALGTATVDVLIAPRADGLAAHLLRVPPGSDLALPALHPHAGRYYVVTQGAVRIDGADAGAMSVAFASADENPTLVAGPSGAEVLVLQFPQAALAGPAGNAPSGPGGTQ